MKPPELSVMWSPSIDTELLFNAHELAPSPDDLSALTDRLRLKTPDTLTAALLRPEERQLELEPHFSGRLDPENASQTPRPPDALRVYIGELSERNILEGFAHALVAQAQLKRRMKVLTWGGAALMVEVGAGSTIQQAGSYWGLLGIPLAGATLGGLWLWHRGWRTTQQVVPSLDGLRSPIRIRGQK
ncbi:MAG TPA: hypothetical protein VJ836_06195 [Candidatus Saccharimonadales bacterium]|nr:hypothetical protein [Candidatus Saccharimonadales bacterium]